MHADLLTDPPEAGAYDLVNAQFMHLPQKERRSCTPRWPTPSGPGGTLLIVAHHPSDLTTSIRRPNLPEMFFTAEEVAAGPR